MQATFIKPEDVKKAENIIYQFIWNLKPTSNSVSGRIKRSTLQCPKDKGGLNAPNIATLNEAIKYTTCLRGLNGTHPIKHILRHKLMNENQSFNVIYNKISNPKTYIDTALIANNKLNKMINNEIDQLSMETNLLPHKEYYQYMANHSLINSTFLNAGQKFMVNNLKTINVNTFGQLKLHKESSQRLFLEVQQIWHSIPLGWRKLANRSNRWQTYITDDNFPKFICIDFNRWLPINSLTMRDVKIRLQSKINMPKENENLNLKFNMNIDPLHNPFRRTRK